MFGKPHPVRYAGKFEFGLKDVGNFPQKAKSIFYDKAKLASNNQQNKTDENEEDNEDGENEEIKGADDESSANSPSIAAIVEIRTSSPQKGKSKVTKTTTKRTGGIQFEGIIIPPSAPRDLICEECEKRTASLYCSACEEVFCIDCADLAHPRVSHNDLMHAHEKDGKIRALQYGDKSRIVIDRTVYLPDEELQMEDYLKIKDLSKPNSLSTGTEAKRFKPSNEKRGYQKFKVNQMVLFKDPVSGRDAYGQIMSEWDQRHGTGVTPAILRGEDSLVYYVVQQHGLLVDIEHLVDLVPGLEEKLNNAGNNTSILANYIKPDDNDEGTVISDASHSTMLVKGTDKDIPLRKEYLIALSINKRLKDLQNILTLGPKHHLRDLRDPKNTIAKQLHPEAFHDDARSHYTIDQSMITSTFPGPTTTIMTQSMVSGYGPTQGNDTSFRGVANVAEASTAGGSGSSAMSPSHHPLLRRDITSPGKVSIAGDRSVLTYKPRLPLLQQYHADSLEQEQAILVESKQPVYDHVDLNLYANIDGDAQTLLSYYNPHYKPLPAPQRSYEDLLRSQESFPIDKSVQKALHTNDEHSSHRHNLFYYTDRYSNGSKDAPSWSTFLVIGESKLESLHDYIEDIEKRKRQLLTRIFNRQDYLWMKLQLHRKFRYWKNNLKAIWIKRQHFCATKIQTRARVWLCREKLNELREYWAQIYEEKRLAVHSQFRFSHRGDKYAVTYDNKKFFATHADMNRYCRFLILMLSRIVRFMNRKRLRLLGKTIVVWKCAIYDFVESTLQNEHIDMQLVEFDQRQYGAFSIDNEKTKMIETFQMLLQSLPSGIRDAQDSGSGVHNSVWYDIRQHNTVSSWPLRMEPPLSFFDTHRAAMDSMNSAAQTGQTSEALKQQQFIDSVPPYDPATMMPYLPELPRISKPQTFKERLQMDVAVSQAAAMDSHEAMAALEGRIPMAGAISHSYWMLPHVVLVGDAPFGPAHVKDWKLVPSYSVFAEKRIYHHEPFPIELQYPYESGCNGFLNDEDIDIVGGITMVKRNKQRAIQRQQEAIAKASHLIMKAPRKKEVLSAITQLLMSGVDTFVSLLSEEEEKLVEEYYKSPPVPKLIDEAMEKAQLSANRIIVDNQDLIRKQEQHLEKIPNYGKTDPRYPQAFREKLRCQARIALAESNITRMRQQVKNIPKNGIHFHRLPVMQHKYPWTMDHVLPSIWKLEKIIAQTMRAVDPMTNLHGKIYFYGGGLAGIEDGPARDGRVGLFMAMIIGRLYHLHPQETLYRWQKAHDCMPALRYMKLTATSSSTTYLTNCPPLPWQKNLLFDVLRRSHLPLDYPTLRIQLEPDRFQDLHRNHYDESLRYQVQLVQAELEAQESDRKAKSAAAAAPPPFKVPGIKIRSNAGVVAAKEAEKKEVDEADKGYSVAYIEAERQEAILRSGKERMKQSEYFHQELIWPPLDKNGEAAKHQAGMGTDFSRKHRSAIVMTGSTKSTRESKREAESRKLARRATKREEHSRKVSMRNQEDDYDSDNGSDSDDASMKSEHVSDRKFLHREGRDDDDRHEKSGQFEEGTNGSISSEDSSSSHSSSHGKTSHHQRFGNVGNNSHLLLPLSPMKEIPNEEEP